LEKELNLKNYHEKSKSKGSIIGVQLIKVLIQQNM